MAHCSVLLQCVAVCCSVLQCVAVCCSVLQCVAVCCSVLQCVAMCCSVSQCVAVCCSLLQCAAVYTLALFRSLSLFLSYSYMHTNDMTHPHEKLLGIRRVSNPSTSIDPGSLKIGFLVLIQNAGFVCDNGTH